MAIFLSNECFLFFLQRERIRTSKDLMEAKRTLEENQRKRYVSYACLTCAISNSELLEEVIFFVYCRMMESRIADKEEEKRARERIRQRIADDMVCCYLLLHAENSA